MGHGHVVAAFRVSGDAPSKGARVKELLLVKVSDAGQEIARLRLPSDSGQESGGALLTPATFSRLVEFANNLPVVTHDGYNWKRFLRQEFASQPKDQVKNFLALTVDVSQWSQQRFPKQRKDLASLCRRLKIKWPAELGDFDREAVALRKIIPHMRAEPAKPPQSEPPAQPAPLAMHAKLALPIRHRLRRAWAILLGTER
jgi:hypothetical protein